ncbi:putative membrane protein [Novosphingobium sp. Rr 2-17]|uniref:DUF6418 domain-containing protein n=1 Tax=Novosphingobium sp. Rr 2-17 TaxID=555793 RepID=UPI0002697AED|nr:DUF6418 domain-containing protein [Novosphingobium sp. Rr 2-17]EIZ81189.1 putative membrane protein [Novosphingobium sp. Rr 2-17]
MPFFLLYCLLILEVLAEATLQSAVWPYVSTLLMLLFLRKLIRKYLSSMAIMLPIIMAKILLLFSLVFIGHHFFIRELGLMGAGSVHSAYFVVISCAFLHISAMVSASLAKTIPPRPLAPFPMLLYSFVVAAIGAALIAIFYLLFTGFTQGFALLDATDRFVYRSKQGWLFGIIITFKPILAGLMGFVRFRMPVPRRFQFFVTMTFAALVASSALFGDKFLSLLVLFGYYFAPFLILQGQIDARAKRIAITLSLLAGVLVSSLTYFIYSDYGALDGSATAERLFGRFTGQGQLWYATMRSEPELAAIDHAELSRLSAVMAAQSADQVAFDTRTGIFHMVVLFAPDNIRNSIFNASGYVQFTGASEAYLALLLGQIPMAFLIMALAVTCGLLVYYVYNALWAGSMPSYFIALFILSNFASMLNQASFWQIFGARALMYIALMVIMDLGLRIMFSGRQRVRKFSES